MGDQEIPFHYSLFENVERGLVTPSMYSWTCHWLQENVSPSLIRDAMCSKTARIQMDIWAEDALHAYHDLPWQTRLDNHKAIMETLEEELSQMVKAERDILGMENPFDPTSHVYSAYNEWVNSKAAEYFNAIERISAELKEEEQWEQGGEDGASQTDGPRYDEMDEP
jgi:hypothetical protein